ncbi:hypothetical protein LO762_18255 [Actinocorallia sp. API 0066]|uniref:hypothetical protein n=1 Tax=Actinocorallia sp. API 0066 TaxID=2896846 RepID=UPI001E5CE5AE|nr:hypothetical protein [Actinocorallia sp. API 0066]MCD0451126.1 hypothetical protein [Actinocorallia sp. API 0066]
MSEAHTWPACRHCSKPVHYQGQWWEHVGGTVACVPVQLTYPPRGTNAAPKHSPDPAFQTPEGQ